MLGRQGGVKQYNWRVASSLKNRGALRREVNVTSVILGELPDGLDPHFGWLGGGIERQAARAPSREQSSLCWLQEIRSRKRARRPKDTKQAPRLIPRQARAASDSLLLGLAPTTVGPGLRAPLRHMIWPAEQTPNERLNLSAETERAERPTEADAADVFFAVALTPAAAAAAALSTDWRAFIHSFIHSKPSHHLLERPSTSNSISPTIKETGRGRLYPSPFAKTHHPNPNTQQQA